MRPEPPRALPASLALALALTAGCGPDGDASAPLVHARAEVDRALAAVDALAATDAERRARLAASERELAALRAELERAMEASSDEALRALRARLDAQLAATARLEREELDWMDALAAARDELVAREAAKVAAVLERDAALEERDALRAELGDARAQLESERSAAAAQRDARVEAELRAKELAAALERERARADGLVPVAAAPAPEPSAELDQTRAELEAARSALRIAEREVARLGDALAARTAEATGLASEAHDLRLAIAYSQERRLERELEWDGYTRALNELGLREMAARLGFPADPDVVESPATPAALEEPSEAALEPPPPDPVAERSDAIERALRALMRIEEVQGLDLLEAGRLCEGGIGPVVFRLLDDRGRLAGGLAAERMHLEASRSARMVTLVLTGGHESRGGTQYPFHNGVRRIPLAHVDPEGWIESAPELFVGQDLAAPLDDGLWDVPRVVETLNGLLRGDAASGWYEVRACSGIVEEALRDVHVVDHDAAGRVRRRLFADRLGLYASDSGVQLALEDGASMRGDRKVGFLDGRMRIYLPLADVERWRAAGLPGLREPEPEPELGEVGPP